MCTLPTAVTLQCTLTPEIHCVLITYVPEIFHPLRFLLPLAGHVPPLWSESWTEELRLVWARSGWEGTELPRLSFYASSELPTSFLAFLQPFYSPPTVPAEVDLHSQQGQQNNQLPVLAK